MNNRSFLSLLLTAFMLVSVQSTYASITTTYASDSTLNVSNREINGVLRKKRILEKVSEDFEQLYNTPNITVKTAECGQSNAFYDPNTQSIILCLEMVDFAYRRAKIVSRNSSERALLVGGSISLILAHELGHAMAHLFKLPITGKEEDFSDQVSLFTAIHGKGSLYGVSAAMLIHNGNDTSLADVHSLDTQRRMNIICWAWGFSPKKFNFVSKNIPQERKTTCPYEYSQIDYAMRRLLGNHLKLL